MKNNNEFINIEDAKSLGLKFYFTGEKCRNGHIDVRFVNNKLCKSCIIKCRKEYSNKKKIYQKEYREKNKENINLKNKEYYLKNKENIRKKLSEYFSDKKELKAEISKKSYHNNKIKECEKRKNRYNSDINYKIKRCLRGRLSIAIRKGFKKGSSIDQLGCSIDELINYLESKFLVGMTWKNYGRTGWHIDHIKPLVLFDLTDEKQVSIVCHYTNLQPLWAYDNLSKGAKVIL